jgi:tRNA threonylcarbamoyladenosine biosynthesis protein TsaB
MGEIYHAAYEKDGDNWREVCAPGLYKPDAAPALPGAGWSACGSGFAVFRDALERRYTGQLERVIDNVVPHAREVAALAARVFARGEAVAAELAAPLYVRNKVALPINERSKSTLPKSDER